MQIVAAKRLTQMTEILTLCNAFRNPNPRDVDLTKTSEVIKKMEALAMQCKFYVRLVVLCSAYNLTEPSNVYTV